MRFAGKVVVVTGAGGGMGFGAARRFGQEGAFVVLVDRDRAAVEERADELRNEGLEVAAKVVDQASSEEVRELFDAVTSEHDRLDACFANAGIGEVTPFLTLASEDWQRTIDVNLTGTFFVCQGAARRMIECGNGGSLVLNASSGVLLPADQFVAYAVSKAGVATMARAIAGELGVHRIRVNAILPGTIDTPMTESILGEHPMRGIVEAETPLGRIGSPDDVAGAVTFLASEDAAYITGTTLLVDGGQTLHGIPKWFTTDHRLAGRPDYVRVDERWRLPVPPSEIALEPNELGGTDIRRKRSRPR